MSLVQLDELSDRQLEFTQAGITNSPEWSKLERQLSLHEQLRCLRYVSMEPNPLPKVQAQLQDRNFSPQMPLKQH